ncbi:MAG TPA: hypothetical protein VI756_11275 [Blastocatellia bacterium]
MVNCWRSNKAILAGAIVGVAFLFTIAPAQMNMRNRERSSTEASNSWRGVTPLKSSVADVTKLIGPSVAKNDPYPTGPFKVEGGEATFSYITPSLADLYHAPSSMVGKVFTVYFKLAPPFRVADPESMRGFKRCSEDLDKKYYYYLSPDRGHAYQVRAATNEIEFEIYQPRHAEIEKLRVNATCVF